MPCCSTYVLIANVICLQFPLHSDRRADSRTVHVAGKRSAIKTTIMTTTTITVTNTEALRAVRRRLRVSEFFLANSGEKQKPDGMQ